MEFLGLFTLHGTARIGNKLSQELGFRVVKIDHHSSFLLSNSKVPDHRQELFAPGRDPVVGAVTSSLNVTQRKPRSHVHGLRLGETKRAYWLRFGHP